MSIFTFTGFEKLFQAALKSRSIVHALNKHKKSHSQAFNLQKKAEKSLGNIKMAVKFDVNRNEENGSRLASVLLVRSVFERYSVKDD